MLQDWLWSCLAINKVLCTPVAGLVGFGSGMVGTVSVFSFARNVVFHLANWYCSNQLLPAPDSGDPGQFRACSNLHSTLVTLACVVLWDLLSWCYTETYPPLHPESAKWCTKSLLTRGQFCHYSQPPWSCVLSVLGVWHAPLQDCCTNRRVCLGCVETNGQTVPIFALVVSSLPLIIPNAGAAGVGVRLGQADHHWRRLDERAVQGGDPGPAETGHHHAPGHGHASVTWAPQG